MYWLNLLRVIIVSVLCGAQAWSDSIVQENLKQGTRDWWHPAEHESLDAPNGFAVKFSYNPGEIVSLKVNSSYSRYNCSIYRLGYYQGHGGRHMATINVESKSIQPKCLYFADSRLTDCSNWDVSLSWPIPDYAISGVYIGVLRAYDSEKNITRTGFYIPFVVRKLNATSDILFKTSDLTWVAYNKFGGWNLYRGNGSFKFDSRAFMASYNRPFSNRLPKLQGGQHQNFLFGTEFPMLFWLEKLGYDISYCSCADIEIYSQSGDLYNKFKILLSVGHDEYWTARMRASYLQSRNSGINLAFFSGNEIFWRVRWLNASIVHSSEQYETLFAGNDLWQNYSFSNYQRIVVCYKETLENRLMSPSKDDYTGTFVDQRLFHDDPMHAITGQYFEVNGFRHDAIEISAEDSGLRFWRNCFSDEFAIRKTYQFPHGYLGYEWDTFRDDCSRPLGLISLSQTLMNISGFLMENFGQSYKGTGLVRHSLSLYRHIVSGKGDMPRLRNRHGVPNSLGDEYSLASAVRTTLDDFKIKKYFSRKNNASAHSKLQTFIHQHPNSGNETRSNLRGQYFSHSPVASSLVFGAGTIQWSWGLSSWHDTDQPVPTHCAIQQATVNLFADMNVQPAKETFRISYLQSNESSRKFGKASRCVLQLATASIDYSAPTSTILFPLHSSLVRGQILADNRWYLNISGIAADADGLGNVASVEVSIDGGFSWALAEGRSVWHYQHPLLVPGINCGRHFRSENIHHARDHSMIDSSHYFQPTEWRSVQQSLNGTEATIELHIVTRAVDDSGWIESCHDLDGVSKNRHNKRSIIGHKHNETVHVSASHQGRHPGCPKPSRTHYSSNNIIAAAIVNL